MENKKKAADLNAQERKYKSFFRVNEDGLVEDMFEDLSEQASYLEENYLYTIENLDARMFKDFHFVEENFFNGQQYEYEFDIKPFWKAGMGVHEIADRCDLMSKRMDELRAYNNGGILADKVDEFIWENIDKVGEELSRTWNTQHVYDTYLVDLIAQEIDLKSLMGIIHLRIVDSEEGGHNG